MMIEQRPEERADSLWILRRKVSQSRKPTHPPEMRLCLKCLKNQGTLEWLKRMNPERAVRQGRKQEARHHLGGHYKDRGSVGRDGKALEGSDQKCDMS